MILSNETNSIVSWETMRIYGLLYIDPPWKQQQAGKKNVRPKSSGGVFSYQIISLEEIKDHLMLEIRYLDKLIDEIAKGRTMEKILRKQ